MVICVRCAVRQPTRLPCCPHPPERPCDAVRRTSRCALQPPLLLPPRSRKGARVRSKQRWDAISPAGRDANEVVENLETDSGRAATGLRQRLVAHDVRDDCRCISCVKTVHGGRTACEPSGCSCGRRIRQEDQIRVVLRTGMGHFATYRRFHCNSRLKSPRAWSTRLPGCLMTVVA